MKHTAEYLFYTILPIIKGNYELKNQYKELLEQKAKNQRKLPYRNAAGREFHWFDFNGWNNFTAYTVDEKGHPEYESYKEFISHEELNKLGFEIKQKVDQFEKDQIENNKTLKQALEKQKKLFGKIKALEDKVPEEMDSESYYNFTQYYIEDCDTNPIEEILIEEELIWEDMVSYFKNQVDEYLEAWNEN